jgi:hypothetical protein
MPTLTLTFSQAAANRIKAALNDLNDEEAPERTLKEYVRADLKQLVEGYEKRQAERDRTKPTPVNIT